MEEFARYAVYYAPPAGDFADRAAAWLGRDALTGAVVAQPRFDGVDDLGGLTREPRRYGFHGTLKPPFRLASGYSAGELHLAIGLLARRLPALQMAGLDLSRLGRFLALTPRGDDAALSDLAACLVRDLDMFRAPLTEAEIARRRPDSLSPRQRALLEDWGYPHVMEEFRFHLTLSDRLQDADIPAIEAAARAWFAPEQAAPFDLSEICLFGEAADGTFVLLHRYALSG